MLTLEMRPKSFAEMAGQDLVKKTLLHICKDPKNSPKTILLQGAYGSGKTTAARIFARALNCEHPLPNGDCCGECNTCKSDIQDSMFYSEYDAAIVGNVDAVKELRNTFYFGYSKGYKVIVLDEVHLVSRQAQGALLKVFEEPEENVFFLLCTTNPEKLLPTIVSRSLELRYETLSKDVIVDHLNKVITNNNLTYPFTPEQLQQNLSLIADRSHGHMRNAIMLLDSMSLLKEDFPEVLKDSRPLFMTLLECSVYYQMYCNKFTKEKTDNIIQDTIHALTAFPISNLKQDYEKLVLDLTRYSFIEGPDQKLNILAKPYFNTFNLINAVNDKVIYELFKNDVQFQIAMHILSNKIKQAKRNT